MAIRYNVTEGDALASQNAADAQRNGVTTDPRDVFTRKCGSSHSITFRNGSVDSTTHGAQRAITNINTVPPGFVRLTNGDITPFRSAQAAGLGHMILEHGEPDHRWGQPQPEGARPALSMSLGAGDDHRSRQVETQAADAKAADASQLAVEPGDKAVIEAGASALASVNEALGSEVVNAAIDDAIVSGELPAELPSGVSQEQVGAIVAAFTAQANTILAETGASVALMDAMLDARDLQEARRAVYLNDDRALKALGVKAVRALERLPENPQAFAEFDLGPNVTVEKKNGEHWVRTPQGSMPWHLAVRTGRIKLG